MSLQWSRLFTDSCADWQQYKHDPQMPTGHWRVNTSSVRLRGAALKYHSVSIKCDGRLKPKILFFISFTPCNFVTDLYRLLDRCSVSNAEDFFKASLMFLLFPVIRPVVASNMKNLSSS